MPPRCRVFGVPPSTIQRFRLSIGCLDLHVNPCVGLIHSTLVTAAEGDRCGGVELCGECVMGQEVSAAGQQGRSGNRTPQNLGDMAPPRVERRGGAYYAA